MKEYLLLYRSKFDYLSLDGKYKNISLSVLKFVLVSDFRAQEKNFLNQELSCYNVSFIYHDFKNKILYIGRADWELDEEIMCPSNEEFSDYINEENSCKMSVDNYLEFRDKWIQLKKDLPPFTLIYRDNLDWISCKGFDTQEEMEVFVKNYKDEVVH